LANYPFIQDVAVVAVAMGGETSGAEDKRLVAYLVPKKGKSLSIPKLRGFLKESLPEYMLPSAFVPLDALPLTSNGKIDRKALPALDAVGFMPDEGYVAPETPLEVSLATMWSEVLRVPKVGTKDNFFNLGGHSLLATQVLARVRETQGVDIPLRTLFEAPTVTALAEAIETARQSGATLKSSSFDDEMEGGLL
jgi:acyl carrier protein